MLVGPETVCRSPVTTQTGTIYVQDCSSERVGRSRQGEKKDVGEDMMQIHLSKTCCHSVCSKTVLSRNRGKLSWL